MAQMSIEEANATLTAAGQMFEVEEIDIRGGQDAELEEQSCEPQGRPRSFPRPRGQATSSSTRTSAPRSKSITGSSRRSRGPSNSASASARGTGSP